MIIRGIGVTRVRRGRRIISGGTCYSVFFIWLVTPFRDSSVFINTKD